MEKTAAEPSRRNTTGNLGTGTAASLLVHPVIALNITRPHDPERIKTAPLISIVIPMLNEADAIERCIHSILQQNYPGDRLEIVVVDGMSRDGSRERVRQLARIHPMYFCMTIRKSGRREASTSEFKRPEATSSSSWARIPASTPILSAERPLYARKKRQMFRRHPDQYR